MRGAVAGDRVRQAGKARVVVVRDVPVPVGVGEVRRRVRAHPHHLEPLAEAARHHHAQKLLTAPELAVARVLQQVDVVVGAVDDRPVRRVPGRARLHLDAAVGRPVVDGGVAPGQGKRPPVEHRVVRERRVRREPVDLRQRGVVVGRGPPQVGD